MKRIVLLMLCVFFSYAYAIDDIDHPDYFNNRYQTGNWTHNKVTPHNTAGSTQPDYFNSSKYNVNSSRDVTSNGSKYKQTTNVVVEASKAEKAATIANRAKNFAEYLKKFGKASLPGILGSAAIYGLMEGVDYVMDPENNTIQKPNPARDAETSVGPYHKYIWYDAMTSSWRPSPVEICKRHAINWTFKNIKQVSEFKIECWGTKISDGSSNSYSSFFGKINPSYNPNANNPIPQKIEVTPDQLRKAIEDALAANNSAQAEAIAQAIKDAFSESDLDKNPNTGEKNNPIADKTKKALDEKGAAELKEDADPTVCVPRPGDLNGQCHSMPKSEADAQPVLKCEKQGWQIDTDDSCVYVIDPNAPTKPGTIEKPGVNPETGELPEACVWFDVHCKWLEWTKDDDLSDDTELDLDTKNEPESNTDIDYSGMCPADKAAHIPAPFNFDLNFTYEPYCSVAEKIKPAVVACGLFLSALILGGIKGSD